MPNGVPLTGLTPPPPGLTPAMGAVPPGAGLNPMAQLAQLAGRGQQGMPAEGQMLLMLLAGAGLETFAKAVQVLRGKTASGGKPGAQAADAVRNPGMTVHPAMAQIMAARAAMPGAGA